MTLTNIRSKLRSNSWKVGASFCARLPALGRLGQWWCLSLPRLAAAPGAADLCASSADTGPGNLSRSARDSTATGLTHRGGAGYTWREQVSPYVTLQTGEQPDDCFFDRGRIVITTYDQLLSGLLDQPYRAFPKTAQHQRRSRRRCTRCVRRVSSDGAAPGVSHSCSWAASFGAVPVSLDDRYRYPAPCGNSR